MVKTSYKRNVLDPASGRGAFVFFFGGSSGGVVAVLAAPSGLAFGGGGGGGCATAATGFRVLAKLSARSHATCGSTPRLTLISSLDMGHFKKFWFVYSQSYKVKPRIQASCGEAAFLLAEVQVGGHRWIVTIR